MGAFIKTYWKYMYGDVKDIIPSDAPAPRGKGVDFRLFVDSDHSGDPFTRRSRTGFVIYLNMAQLFCSPSVSQLWSQVSLELSLLR
jgi:hypothetical protein